MSLLLDTHPFVWFLLDPKRIPARLMALLIDPSRIVHISAVAVWEATIKSGLSKLALPLDRLEATIAAAGFGVAGDGGACARGATPAAASPRPV